MLSLHQQTALPLPCGCGGVDRAARLVRLWMKETLSEAR
jgi:hypothetical protein